MAAAPRSCPQGDLALTPRWGLRGTEGGGEGMEARGLPRRYWKEEMEAVTVVEKVAEKGLL